MKNNNQVIGDISALKPIFWKNDKKICLEEFMKASAFKYQDIVDADNRLRRFASLIKQLFPETIDGIIESPLVKIDNFKQAIEQLEGDRIRGRMYLKCDSHMKIAGSIKARGGIYEVLKHAETLALEKKLLDITMDYSILNTDEFRRFFSEYSIAVGSTGNLGLSIGIISTALGFKVTVHMSRDAKQWKKDLLRSKGAIVIEYSDDYSKAVAEGRKTCELDEKAYFIDDENSSDLFLGYAVAALRLKDQLSAQNVIVDNQNPAYIYLPCGVGGAPAGITFGLKSVFGEAVHCYFVEPTHSPCMLLGLVSEKYNKMHISEYGIDNITEADGLAVGTPSGLACKIADQQIDGIYTIDDNDLLKYLTVIKDTEQIKIEPSAAAGLPGAITTKNQEKEGIHICWATGGALVPEEIYQGMYHKGKLLLLEEL
jgi:D-serine dehydratase